MSIPVALQFDIYYLDLLFSTTYYISFSISTNEYSFYLQQNNADKGNLNNDNLVCSGYGISS